ncbi:MAG: penicillin-binding protein 2 [Candidatus Paceibacterota bacterium]|jgi:cell division protein FtsI/penicillin-binding protein 2
MKSNNSFRIKFSALLIFLTAVLFIIRLFFIQVVKADFYCAEAEKQHFSSGSVDIYDRGTIFFTDKNGKKISAATLETSYLLVMNPTLVKLAEEVWEKISSLVDLDKEKFLNSANKKKDVYEELASGLTKETVDKILKLRLKGIYLVKQKKRFYPAGSSAAHLIGLMGYKGDEYAGRYGLESFYDSTLSREKDLSFANFFVETFATLSKTASVGEKASIQGDIVTTIEPVVQKFLESQLAEARERFQGDLIAGMVMDPQTGEVIAMSAWPTFDPGAKITDLSVLPNPFVGHIYEMGSTIKPIAIAAALDAGVITSDSTYNDTGCALISGERICNYDNRARGITPIQEILNQSLNLGMAFVARQLGQDKFRAYYEAFGFGEKTYIDLPGETTGKIKNIYEPYEINYATAAFGQGISFTPIATVRALSVLGNGGKLVKPHVVKEINYKNKLTRTIKPKVVRQVIKKEVSEEISRMLVQVVDKKLAGGKIKLEHYSVAAKTGTAQMVDPVAGKYYSDRYLHTFFGYFPAFNPRFIIFMFIKNPKGVLYSSETLTEPFSNLTKFLLNYYQVPPDR